MVSICLLTIDRYDLTKEYVGSALKYAGHPYELLVVDNGSKDKRIIEYIQSLEPSYHRLNESNQGTPAMINQMILRAKGEYICFIGNDIKLPGDWLGRMVHYNKQIPESGISGIHCVQHLPEETTHKGLKVRWANTVFGTMFFNRRILDKVGYPCEEYGLYGRWDGDYNLRERESGFKNYYIGDMKSTHMGHDVGHVTEYRKMKDESLRKANEIFNRKVKEYETNGYYIGPPAAN